MNRNKKYLVVGILVFIVVLSLGCIDIEIKDNDGGSPEATSPQTTSPLTTTPVTTQSEITFLEGNPQRILLIVEENDIAKASSIYDIRSEEEKAINVEILPALSDIKTFHDEVVSKYGSVGKIIIFSTNALYNSIGPDIYIKDILKGIDIDRDTLVDWVIGKRYPPQNIQGDQKSWEFRGDLLTKWFTWHCSGEVPIKITGITNDNTTFYVSIENNTWYSFVGRESFVCHEKTIEEYDYRYCAGSDVRQVGGEDSFAYGIYAPNSEIQVVILDSSENEIANGVAEAGTNIHCINYCNQIEVTVENITPGEKYIIIIRAEGITTIEKYIAM